MAISFFRLFCGKTLAVAWAFALLSPLLAQPAAGIFQKAPPAVDQALRKRVTDFYQTHVTGKTRLAQSMVAEESADVFFNAQKPKLESFEISQVTYAKDFQEATVLILAEREVMIPLAGAQMLKVPMESHWKQVEGQWLWHIPAQNCHHTPFGCMVEKTSADSGKSGAKATPEEIARKIKDASALNFEGKFGFEESATELSGSRREVVYTFRNGLQGWLTLKMLQAFSDPEFELVGAEVQVKPESTVQVIARLKKGIKVTASRKVQVPLLVQPFNQSAGLTVRITP